MIGKTEGVRRKGRGFGPSAHLVHTGSILGGVALASLMFVGTAAQAQNCTVAGLPAGLNPAFITLAQSVAAFPSFLGGTVAGIDTALLTNSNAFVSAPPDPKPGQMGGGVWARGVGGQVNVTSSSTLAATVAVPGAPPLAGSASCSGAQTRQNYGGVQVGADVARLNLDGWNVHIGTTASYLESRGGNGGFNANFQIPSVGGYLTVTNGGFFADVLIREDFYQANLSSTSVNPLGFPLAINQNQNVNAHGVAVSGSIGYQYRGSSGWFIEPSAGLIWTRVSFDPISLGALPLLGPAVAATVAVNDYESEIGRLGVRAGTSINGGSIVWQPFAAVSVWHDFKGVASGSVTVASPLLPATGTFSSSSVGTFGQYSAGISGQIVNTGWLGFARFDYRNGPNIEGESGTIGVRYTFTPDPERKRVPIIAKAPILKAPAAEAPISWTGLYFGGFLGADHGHGHWGFATGGSVDPQVAGILGGGQIGYNVQTGAWVFGVEGDLGTTNARGGMGCGPLLIGAAPAPMFNMTCNAQAAWIATATGRVGYAWERALYFVKGGGAWTNETFSATCNLAPVAGLTGINCTNAAGVPSNGLSASDNRFGWTVGFGTEFALTRNWSAKAEYDYMDFGNRNLTASDGSSVNAGLRLSEVKVGVNYRIGATPGPIATKY
jgi:opacity protein-like surface antigen